MEYDTDEAPEKPGAARPWLQKLEDAKKAFQVYDDKCASIEKQFANLKDMAEAVGDREFQIFWANLETLKPAIYTRAPRPVVMPRHSDLGAAVRKASELVERVLQFDIEEDDLHETLLEVRNDLAMSARGVAWVLDNGQALHVERCDFLHEPARKWREVGWVARRAYVTRKEGVERFGEAFLDAECAEIGNDREDDWQSSEKKAEVWEIWCKVSRKVVWVTEGVEDVLEESDPLVDVKGFFPCPKPAYGTLEPGTLKPVPDFVYYRDQVDEINELTGRISALSESLRLKGFYAAGTSEVGEAIEAAMKQVDNKAILVPISNFAALGGGNLKDSIVWLPVEEIGNLIATLVQLRKQLIEDVYEITGLSDIMRGATEAHETLGAQRLKAQYGSVRVADRQGEMVRMALDVLRLKAEIYAETVPGPELMQMAAMQFPTMQQVQQMATQHQQEVARVMQAAQQQGGEVIPPPEFKPPVSIDQIDQILKSQRMRPFLMEIETDSTISPDEQAEKESRVEFITAVGGFMQQTYPIIANAPEIAPFAGKMLRFVAGGFRAGRDMGGTIDDLIEAVTAKAQGAGQQQQPDPEAIKAQAESQRLQMEMQKFQQEMQIKQAEMQIRQQEIAAKSQREIMESETRAFDAKARMAVKQFELALKAEELGIKQDETKLKAQQAEIEALLAVEEIDMEREQQRAVKIGNDG